VSRPETLDVSSTALYQAAERAVRSCGPALARMSRSMIDPDQAKELDEARGSLLSLAEVLESHRRSP
jgi:hypothetical protein